jgi:hypothetical protein
LHAQDIALHHGFNTLQQLPLPVAAAHCITQGLGASLEQ